jgi:lipid-A-disaccharide synthase
MKYYIIAGEASGDLHGANLIKALKKEDSEAEFRVWGGDLMQAEGTTLVKHYRDLAFMGFIEVVKNLKIILGNIAFCKKDIKEYQPDAIILIDYPGFNLRIAKWAKKENIKTKVFYYISPQIWAWHTSRVHQIKRTIDKMFVILPFEKDFYKKYNYEVDFVGHPLLDAIENFNQNKHENDFFIKNDIDENKKIIALLPGSRKQEISKLLPLMIASSQYFPDYQYIIAGAPAMPATFYKEFIKTSNIKIIHNQTYALLQNAHAALVTSGTATLETALFGVPEVVCYKGSSISYQIAKRLVNIKYISLVNLIADKEIVKELIQDEYNLENIKINLTKILEAPNRTAILENYNNLKDQLGKKGASQSTAILIYKYLKPND